MEKISIISDRIIRIGFGLLFILVPLILTPWNYELFEYNKMMVTYGLSSVIIGAWLIKMIVGNEIRIKRTPLDVPIILFVLSQLVSTLFSMDPHVSWFGYYSRFNGGMFSVLTYVSLYYAFVSNFLPLSKFEASTPINLSSIIHRLLQVMLITGLIVSLYGIAEHFGIDKNIWIQDVQNRVFSTLGQPNWLAAYLMALIPLAMAFSLYALSLSHSEDRRQRAEDRSTFFSLVFSVFRFPFSVFYFVISIVFFITLLWTRSRSGFVAFAVADVVFWIFVFIRGIPLKGVALKRATIHPFLLIHAVFFLIVILNGVYVKQIDDWITIKAWQQRFTKISSPPSQSMEATSSNSAINNSSQPSAPLIESGVTESGDIRKYVWQGAVNAWRSSLKTLFIGTGTETYAFAFYLYKPIGHNLTSEWDFLYNKAHNEYLNFLATTGILGLGTYLILIGVFIMWFIKVQLIPLSSRVLSNIEGRRDLYNKDCFAIARNDILFIGLFSGWLSILITNFFGFSVVITQLMFYLFPAIIFSLTDKDAPPPADGRGMMRPSYLTYPLDWQMKAKKIASAIIWIITILLVVALFVTWYSDKQFARGYHLARSGYKPQAYQALSSAITFNPTEPIFHDEQGTILSTLALAAWKENQATMSQELATLSIKENDTALSISPNNVNFWKSRTKIFYALSSVDPSFLKEAINALEKGLTLSPLDPKMYYNLAVLYGQAGLSDKSSEFMKKSIELKPNYREGYYGLFLLYKEAGMPTEAQQTINEYLTKVDPTDKEFLELIQ
jgi:tetratricopeptide (TPR) repeat protein